MSRSRMRRRSANGDDAGTAPDQFGVQSVEIAADVLKALASQGRALPLRELAAAAGMQRAKVHRYLVSLRRAGLVTQDRETGAYRIGPAAVTLGLAGLRSISPLRQLMDALPALRDRIDETVTLAIWGDAGPTIVAMEESSHVVTMNLRVGSVLPVAGTAIGRVFAAYLPPAKTKAFIAAERRPRRAPGPPTPRLLAGQVKEIERRGLSRAHAPLLPGVDALAAPVFGYAGTLVAVICAVGRSATMDSSWEGKLARTLHATARALSHDLGFTDPG